MVCGLWHGASSNFILWGAIHGLALVTLKFFTYKRKLKGGRKTFQRFISIFFTFHFIALTWIIFRGTGSGNMYVMIRKIFFNFHPELILQVLQVYPLVFILILSGFILHWLPSKWKSIPSEAFINFPEPVKILVIATAVVFIYQFKSSGIVPFIYFDFWVAFNGQAACIIWKITLSRSNDLTRNSHMLHLQETDFKR